MNNKKLFYVLFLSLMSSILFLTACTQNEQVEGDKNYSFTNINIFKETPAWELAKAVKDQRTSVIKKIAKKDPQLLDYQESKYGVTLLIWATGMEKYKSVKTLLECGANPNIASKRYETYDEETPLSLAAGFSWIDSIAKEDPKYVKILLKHGADPNWTYLGAEHGTEPGTSILMASIGCGIEKTKALVEGGADINHKTKSGNTAAFLALGVGPNSTKEGLMDAHYLVYEKRAVVSEPYFRGTRFGDGDPNDKFYPVRLLNDWMYALESEEFKIKMDIVKEFERQGVNYWDREIDSGTIEEIKKRYPDIWEEYVKKY